MKAEKVGIILAVICSVFMLLMFVDKPDSTAAPIQQINVENKTISQLIEISRQKTDALNELQNALIMLKSGDTDSTEYFIKEAIMSLRVANPLP